MDAVSQPGSYSTDVRRVVGDAIALGLSKTSGFEVLTRETVERAAKEENITTPRDFEQHREKLAGILAANVIVRSQVIHIDTQNSDGKKIVTLRVDSQMEAPGTDGELATSEAIGKAVVGPDGEEKALIRAALNAAKRTVLDLRGPLREGAVLNGGKNPIVIGLGSSDGVKPGDRALLLRGGKSAGRLKITAAFPNYSTAQIITAPKGVDRVLISRADSMDQQMKRASAR
jgi:hypothetical protein